MNREQEFLKQQVEACLGQEVLTSRHFNLLRDSIYGKTGILLSTTTLKRLWGYLDEPTKPSRHTLDSLSRYAGWSGWNALRRYATTCDGLRVLLRESPRSMVEDKSPSMNNNQEFLKQQVEACLGQEVQTSRHFNLLRDKIYEKTGVLLSATTLKRLWGYLDEPTKPSRHTLDTLSRYAGWNGWNALRAHAYSAVESGPVGKSSIDVNRQLKPGVIVTLFWQPERMCKVKYLGNEEFVVISSVKTRLLPGDTFHCSLLICDEPVYLEYLQRDGVNLGLYVCGRRSGVRFSIT